MPRRLPATAAQIRAQAVAHLQAIRFDALEQLASTRFAHFVRLLWPVVEPSTPLRWNWHLDAICEEVEHVLEHGGDLVVSEPPGYAKSLILSVFLPSFAFLQDPSERMIYLAGSDSLAYRDATKTRRIMLSGLYRRLISRRILALRSQVERGEAPPLGAYAQIVRSNNPQPWSLTGTAVSNLQTELGGNRWAFPFGGHITGERGRILVVDDPLDAKKFVLASSERQAEICDDCVRVFDQALQSRLSPFRPVRIVIAQRLHERDLPGTLARRPGWRKVVIPEEFDPTRDDIHPRDPRTEPGELAFPEVYTEEKVAQRKKSWGERQYAAQGNQDPRPGSGGLLDAGLGRCRPLRFLDNPITLGAAAERLLVSVDATFGGRGKTASFVSIQAWDIGPVHKRLLYQRRGRWGFAQTEREIRAVCLLFRRYKRVIIEAKANGPALLERLAGSIRRLEGADPKASKEGRAGVLAIEMEAGQVSWPHPDNPWIERVEVEYRDLAARIPEALARGERWALQVQGQGGGLVSVPWVVLWEDELGRFPGGRDDQVDSSAMAVIVGSEWGEDAYDRARTLESKMAGGVTMNSLFRRRMA